MKRAGTSTGTVWRKRDRVYDPATGRTGVIQHIDHLHGRPHEAWLRPEAGGLEWTAYVWELQPPPAST